MDTQWSEQRIWIGPFDEQPTGVGNGAMTAFLANGPAMIDRLYDIAMRMGGSDEGGPGFRPQYGEGFYGAYVRDPDGNKLAFVCYDTKPTGQGRCNRKGN